MKKLVVKIIYPVTAGLFMVVLSYMSLMLLAERDRAIQIYEQGVFKLFFTIFTLSAYIIQALVILPVWKKHKQDTVHLKRNIVILVSIFSAIGSGVFLLVFGFIEQQANNLLMLALLGFLLFAIYWSINLHVLYRLDKYE